MRTLTGFLRTINRSRKVPTKVMRFFHVLSHAVEDVTKQIVWLSDQYQFMDDATKRAYVAILTEVLEDAESPTVIGTRYERGVRAIAESLGRDGERLALAIDDLYKRGQGCSRPGDCRDCPDVWCPSN